MLNTLDYIKIGNDGLTEVIFLAGTKVCSKIIIRKYARRVGSIDMPTLRTFSVCLDNKLRRIRRRLTERLN